MDLEALREAARMGIQAKPKLYVKLRCLTCGGSGCSVCHLASWVPATGDPLPDCRECGAVEAKWVHRSEPVAFCYRCKTKWEADVAEGLGIEEAIFLSHKDDVNDGP